MNAAGSVVQLEMRGLFETQQNLGRGVFRMWAGSFVLGPCARSGNSRLRTRQTGLVAGVGVACLWSRCATRGRNDFVIEPSRGRDCSASGCASVSGPGSQSWIVMHRFLEQQQNYGALRHRVNSTCRDGSSTGSLLAGALNCHVYCRLRSRSHVVHNSDVMKCSFKT